MTPKVSDNSRTRPIGLHRSLVLKRCLDYMLGIPLVLCALPLMALVAFVIKLVSPGPVLFIQEREGFKGRKIRMLKFRTMYVDADERLKTYLAEHSEREAEWLQFFKLESDPRVLPRIGPFLRRSSLDELPNLWNLLRGDISLVGPRPFPYYHLAQFDPDFRALRQTVRPGLTGPWQIVRGDVEAQVALDTYYIQNWSIWLDLRLLLKTVPVVLRGQSHY